jgi:hypothetical protein
MLLITSLRITRRQFSALALPVLFGFSSLEPAFGQAPRILTQRGKTGELSEAAYRTSRGTVVSVRVATSATDTMYFGETIVREDSVVYLTVRVAVPRRRAEPQFLGKADATFQGVTFYQLIIDASGVPATGPVSPPTARARLLVRTADKIRIGSFNFRSWRPERTSGAPPLSGPVLPESLNERMAPLIPTLRTEEPFYEHVSAGAFSAVPGRTPVIAMAAPGRACRAACWSIPGAIAATVCTLAPGAPCILSILAAGAASSVCSDGCPR